MNIKLNQTKYINVAMYRGFIYFHTVYNYLQSVCGYEPLEKIYKQLVSADSLGFSHPYDTKKEAFKNCTRICDGYTELTIGVTLLDIGGHDTYSIALSTPTKKKKYRERVVVDVNKNIMNNVLGLEIN